MSSVLPQKTRVRNKARSRILMAVPASGDAASGMTVTAGADFCGVSQPAITQLLNKIRDFDPITNELPESLKQGCWLHIKRWKLSKLIGFCTKQIGDI